MEQLKILPLELDQRTKNFIEFHEKMKKEFFEWAGSQCGISAEHMGSPIVSRTMNGASQLSLNRSKKS